MLAGVGLQLFTALDKQIKADRVEMLAAGMRAMHCVVFKQHCNPTPRSMSSNADVPWHRQRSIQICTWK